MSERTIILGGVNINELNNQRLALMKDANKFIAEKQSFCEGIASAGFENLTLDTAKQFLAALEDMALVAHATGACYYVPYYSEYREPTWLGKLEDLEHGDAEDRKWFDETLGPIWDRLYSQLDEMQTESYQWHNSNCY